MDAAVVSLEGYQFNPHALGLGLAAVALVCLGLYVLSRDRHSPPGQLFFWFTMALADYFACFCLASLSLAAGPALSWVRLGYLGVPVVPVLLFTFVGSLAERPRFYRRLLYLGWTLAGLLVLTAQTTDWLIAGVDRQWWGYYKRYGGLGPLFVAYTLFFCSLSGIYYRRLLQSAQRSSRGRQRLRLHLRALGVGCLIVLDFVAAFGWPLYPVGYLAALALAAILFTAMRRYGPVFFTPVLAAGMVLETMGEALFVVDEDGLVRKANRAAEDLLQRPREDLVGQPLASLLPVPQLGEGVLKLFAPGRPRSLETSFVDEQGRTRHMSLTGNCLTNSRGDALAALCVVRDISQEHTAQEALLRAHDLLEQKVAERTKDLYASNQALLAENQQRRLTEALLRQSEEKYRLLVDNAREAIFICQDGLIRFSNQHCREVFGYRPEELNGKNFLDLLHPQERMQWPQGQACPLPPTPAGQGRVWRALTKAGQAIALQAQSASITWEGRPANLYFMQDVTAKKEMEAQLAHASKLQALGTLASGIAHDFNNLLQAVAGYTHLLRQLPAQGQHRRYLEEISQAVERGGQLVKSLLSHGRQLPAGNQAVDVNQLVEQAAQLLGRTIPKMIELRLELDPGLPLVLGDQAQLEQVLLNLGANARDAMPAGGTITITTSQVHLDQAELRGGQELAAGAYVLITFADSGLGMDDVTLGRAFEPFFTTKALGQGNGLGLFMAYGVAQRHGGLISGQSQPGQGTTFSIYLPVPAQEPVAAQAKPLLAGGRGSESILLVDDEPQVLEPAAEVLSLAGYQVLLAQSSEQALEMVQGGQVRPSLVVLDLGMPGMGGLEGLKRLKLAAPGLRVIVASGYDLPEMRQQVAAMGAWGFLAKPYRLGDLLATVRQALHGPLAPTGPGRPGPAAE